MNHTKKLLLALVFIPFAFSCKKSENDQCESGPGFGIPTSVTLWISKDKGWGQLTLQELYYYKDDGTKYEGSIWYGTIDRYFNSEPECEAQGTIYFSINPGQKAEYKLIADDGKIFEGWIRADCEGGCQFQDISQY